MHREKTNSKYKKTAFGSFKKVSNFGLLASLIVAMVFFGYTTQKGNNSEAMALPQTQPRTTTVSSNQQSSSMSSSNNGDQASNHSNTQDAISTSSNSDGGASSSSSSSGSSSDTNNLTGDINGLVGNINKNINRIIQNSVQNSVSGTVSASAEVNKMFSGKIASSQLNLKTGTVERIVFGDWSLDAKSGKDAKFSAKFSIHSTPTSSVSPPPSSSEKLASPGSYSLSNLKINGVQKTNEDMTLRGTVDITRQSGTSTQSWMAVPTTVSVTNHSTLMIMSFDQTSPVSQVLQNVPVIGVITASS
jgi:trimeric autotransporter adhesin